MAPAQSHSNTHPRRYPGDGLDFRRPVTLSRQGSQTPVIDLTLTEDDTGPSASSTGPGMQRATQRPPRFAREIIVVDEDGPHAPTAAPPASPEVEFISSRPLPGRPTLGHLSARAADMLFGDSDDIEITGSNPVPPEVRRRQAEARRQGEILTQGQIDDTLRRMFSEVSPYPAGFFRLGDDDPIEPSRRPGGRRPAGRPHHRRGHTYVGHFHIPDLDFGTVGFDLVTGDRPAPPPPTYKAPEPVAAGFARSGLDEIGPLACPNCDQELCVGDSDLQKQVWILKGCGHVYCGMCATNRFQKKSLKGKEKAAPEIHRPFKECAVEGCNKKTSSPKSMIQIFL